MKIVLLIGLLFLSNHCFSSIKDKTLAGTPTRVEKEFKMAFKLKGRKVTDISNVIKIEILQLISTKAFSFPKIVSESYVLDPQFKSFVFRDYYLDSPDKLLLKNEVGYRLRYRWSSLDKFDRFQIFPFLKFYYPDRCEVQFKEGYNFNSQTGIATVNETRFEFRNESEPFNKNKNAPRAPWKLKKFLNIAQAGEFKNYLMLPSIMLEKKIGKTIRELKLKVKTEMTTRRFRTHLNIFHPWGSGPNPWQSFIITLDDVYFKNIEKGEGRFFEIEIEIERNASREIFKLSDNASKESPKEAQEISTIAKIALEKDLMLLREKITKRLKKEFEITPMAIKSKYMRTRHVKN
ncbi:MAG: hypothetical protein KC493_16540 [Bacteriovoracaceae bacterium]|nr:hypothetical protein [Bacteriovoracaceae bacterium]